MEWSSRRRRPLLQRSWKLAITTACSHATTMIMIINISERLILLPLFQLHWRFSYLSNEVAIAHSKHHTHTYIEVSAAGLRVKWFALRGVSTKLQVKYCGCSLNCYRCLIHQFANQDFGWWSFLLALFATHNYMLARPFLLIDFISIRMCIYTNRFGEFVSL